MIRLVLLLAPAASACAGLAIATILEWVRSEVSPADDDDDADTAAEADEINAAAEEALSVTLRQRRGRRSKKGRRGAAPATTTTTSSSSSSSSRRSGGRDKRGRNRTPEDPLEALLGPMLEEYRSNPSARFLLAVCSFGLLLMSLYGFLGHCSSMAVNLSEPQIMYRTQSRDGRPMMIDDFREAYWWLRDHTPEDSRVMAWWDYGYQINGVANRTTIADGNTWNHEHIALLGKCLVSSEKEAHTLIRHLADYVLVWSTRWAGMWGDDLAKMPHMGRIGGSVYKDVDQHAYFQDHDGKPSPGMRNSLLFLLHSYRLDPEVEAPTLFEEAYTSKHNMVRIYKVKRVSKRSKRECAERRGYPTALLDVIAKKHDFKQH